MTPERLIAALAAADESTRLKAALAIGSHPEPEVARSAWRAAVVLVPNGQEKELAEELAAQLGRGDRDVQLTGSERAVNEAKRIFALGKQGNQKP